MADAPAFGIGLILLIAIVIVIISIFVYMFVWRPDQPAPACSSNIQCGNGQICSSGICQEIICSSNNDCGGNGFCVNSYCLYNSCNNGQECGQDQACINGQCTKINQNCNSNNDCPNGTNCNNNKCSQCFQNSDCPTGQGCINGSCQYPTINTVPPTGSVVIPVIAPGNLLAPEAVICNSATCANNGSDTAEPIPCSETQSCPGGCLFCASGYCKCTPGLLYESCVSNNDCQSGVCSSNLKICIGSNGQCARNYDSSDPNNPNNCTVKSPYCVDGLCSQSSLGAPCAIGPAGTTPADICRNPAALGSNLAAASDNAGFNCVNGFCQQDAGKLNQQCTSGSCEIFSNDNLVCTNTTGKLRCQIGTT